MGHCSRMRALMKNSAEYFLKNEFKGQNCLLRYLRVGILEQTDF